MLKCFLLALVLIGLIYTAAPAAVAQASGSNDQQSASPGAQPERGPVRGRMGPAQHAAIVGKRLNLRSDQQAKVQDIFKSEQSQMDSLRSDTSLPQQDRLSKIMDVHKSANDQVRALLDPDQQKKWDEMQASHSGRPTM